MTGAALAKGRRHGAGVAPPVDGPSGRQSALDVARTTMLAIEAASPDDLLDRAGLPGGPAAWRARVAAARDAPSLRPELADLEASLADDALHADFPRRPKLVRGAWAATDCDQGRDADAARVAPRRARLDWLPPTPSSLALRVLALDAALAYDPDGDAKALAPLRVAGTRYRCVTRPGPANPHRPAPYPGGPHAAPPPRLPGTAVAPSFVPDAGAPITGGGRVAPPIALPKFSASVMAAGVRPFSLDAAALSAAVAIACDSDAASGGRQVGPRVLRERRGGGREEDGSVPPGPPAAGGGSTRGGGKGMSAADARAVRAAARGGGVPLAKAAAATGRGGRRGRPTPSLEDEEDDESASEGSDADDDDDDASSDDASSSDDSDGRRGRRGGSHRAKKGADYAPNFDDDDLEDD